MRGRAFSLSQAIQFAAVPAAALMSWLLLPESPFGISGWRLVAAFPALAAIAVWFIRRRLPESPRWLARQGRTAEADRVTTWIEARVAADLDHALPPPGPPAPEETGTARFAEIWRPPYRRRTIMLSVFNFFQAIGFYGFGNWVPTLLAAQGAGFTKSLEYGFIIALASPASLILFMLFADRIERKFQIVGAACGTAGLGLLFSQAATPAAMILLGIGITATNNLMSFAYHAYQAELFPTRVRARAVGFVYSFSRLSTVVNSFMIAYFLAIRGTVGVFAFISAAMLVVVVSIGVFGPRTRGRALEEISH
jgi:putative MFS transporter